ncbi:MAG: cytochrome c [Myxococcales bacterium]|nr:cytochrome c [Myxococcales bacterium]
MLGLATLLVCVSVALFPGLLPGAEIGAGNALTRSRSDVSGTLRFLLRGEVQSTKVFDDLVKIVSPSKVRVFEPYEQAPADFYALPFNAVLDGIYGEQWRVQDEVLLTCADGYQPVFSVRRLLDYKAWLAFDRADAPEFSILKFESGERRRVDLSPYYLIWDNYDDPELRRQGDYGWPYQLIGVDFIRAQDRFPKMTPAAGASTQVLAGFASFRAHCTRCHAINGEGGSVGPELNVPRNPVEYREATWLRQWIDDPSSLIAGARMPALNKELVDRDQVIDDILAYLSAISQQKIPPKAVTRDES